MNIFTDDEIKEFEQIWIEQNVHSLYNSEKQLNDDKYINYHIWEDLNWKEMYKKDLPKTIVFRGNNPILVFHGGCLSCKSQQTFGVERCKGCKYFKCDWNKPDLSIREKVI